MSDVSFLPEPCALPEQRKQHCLNKEKLVYAPLSGVGRVLYDKHAVYVDLGGSHGFQDEVGPTHELVQTFFSTHSTKMASSRVMLFSGSKPLGSENIDNHGVRDGFGFPVLCAPVWLLNPAGELWSLTLLPIQRQAQYSRGTLKQMLSRWYLSEGTR
nr:ribosome biogenesis protein BMS1 homolog isoform X1 [Macaca nemestrina]